MNPGLNRTLVCRKPFLFHRDTCVVQLHGFYQPSALEMCMKLGGIPYFLHLSHLRSEDLHANSMDDEDDAFRVGLNHGDLRVEKRLKFSQIVRWEPWYFKCPGKTVLVHCKINGGNGKDTPVLVCLGVSIANVNEYTSQTIHLNFSSSPWCPLGRQTLPCILF